MWFPARKICRKQWIVLQRRKMCFSQNVLFSHDRCCRPFHPLIFFFCKQKTAYDISECDWSSDVCSSELKQKTAYEISELQSHSEISYAVFCLKKKKQTSELKSNTENSYAIFRMKTEEKK